MGSVGLPTGKSLTNGYDGLNRITERMSDTIIPLRMTYTYLEDEKGGNFFVVSTYQVGKDLYSYTYDGKGNIQSVRKNGVQLSSYEYQDTNWEDKLTCYNGQSLTYDEVGNPLNYRDGMELGWKNGRELAGLSNSANSISYAYNSDEMDITDKNLYSYCDNNPITRTDTNGNVWISAAIGSRIAGAIIGASSYFITQQINGKKVDALGLAGAAFVGAYNGFIGGFAGFLPNIGLKAIASAAVGVSTAIYAMRTSSGTTKQRGRTAIIAGVTAFIGTFAGTTIDLNATMRTARFLGAILVTTTCSLPGEMVNAGVQYRQQPRPNISRNSNVKIGNGSLL